MTSRGFPEDCSPSPSLQSNFFFHPHWELPRLSHILLIRPLSAIELRPDSNWRAESLLISYIIRNKLLGFCPPSLFPWKQGTKGTAVTVLFLSSFSSSGQHGFSNQRDGTGFKYGEWQGGPQLRGTKKHILSHFPTTSYNNVMLMGRAHLLHSCSSFSWWSLVQTIRAWKEIHNF